MSMVGLGAAGRVPKIFICEGCGKSCCKSSRYTGGHYPYCARCTEEIESPTLAYDESLSLFVGACMLVATAAVVAAFAIPMGWLS